MSWQPKTKKNKRIRRSLAIAATVSLMVAGGVSAAGLMPGEPNIGNIMNGTVFGGGGGGTFYDFESVFAEGGGNGGFLGIGGIFNDLFGGADGLGILEDIIGGEGGLVSDCGIVIMNFAPSESNPDCAGGAGSTLYDTVIGEVTGELGLPDEITGILTGRSSVEDLFADLMKEELAKIGVESGGGEFGVGDLVGKEGIPTPDGLLDELLAAESKPTFTATLDGNLPSASEESSADPAISMMTPGVNTTLTKPVIALGLLTKAVTDRGLSAEGQEVTSARNMAAQASSRTSGIIGEKSVESAEKQLEAATEMDTTVREQTSTQDTLKEALTGMNTLQAQSTQLQAQANSQQAISTQVDGMSLQVAQEMRDGVFANGISLKTLNDQTLGESQRQMALDHSIRSDQATSIRTMGAFR
jgi:hypothetical protein